MIRTRVIIEEGENGFTFPIDDRIFLGEGLFETLKIESAKPCYALLHWERLSESAKKLSIPFDLSFEHWLENLLFKIKKDNIYNGGIKAILSGGSAPRGLASQGQVSHLMLQTFNYTIERDSLRLVTAPWLRDAANPVYQVKSVNYLEAILARRKAHILEADDVLFFNLQNHATETTCANLFIIHQEQLHTPPLTDGVLSGITRSRVLKLAEQINISCSEISVTKTMLHEADAVFTTNSLQGIRSVRSLDNTIFPVNHPWINLLIDSLSV